MVALGPKAGAGVTFGAETSRALLAANPSRDPFGSQDALTHDVPLKTTFRGVVQV